MEARCLNRYNVTFGFYWDNEKNDIAIDDEKAYVVRKVFGLYVFRRVGASKIADEIAKRYDVVVTTNTITKWFCETAYVGIFHMNK